jgi:peptide deformylase
MSVRDILLFSDHEKELRRRSEEVRQDSRQIKQVVRDLKDTLRANSDGIGLAAPQVNIHKRVVIVCLDPENTKPWKPGSPKALINPLIVEERNPQKDYDGCLSFPGLYGETVRPHYLRVIGLYENGEPFDRLFEGFNAVLLHHEIDHLDGVLFIDRIETTKDLYTIQENERGEMVKISYDQLLSGYKDSNCLYHHKGKHRL